MYTSSHCTDSGLDNWSTGYRCAEVQELELEREQHEAGGAPRACVLGDERHVWHVGEAERAAAGGLAGVIVRERRARPERRRDRGRLCRIVSVRDLARAQHQHERLEHRMRRRALEGRTREQFEQTAHYPQE